jgi:signal transduction histidine kinase
MAEDTRAGSEAADGLRLRPAWIVTGVSGAWLLVGVVLGSQTALGMTMQGSPVVLGDAIRTALVNNLPWIPGTLVAIVIADRFPFTRRRWLRVLPIHLAAVPVVSWIANLGVVLGFWWMSGSFGTPAALARQAAFWATIRLHVAALVYGATVALTHGWAYLRDARHREVRVARLETQLNRARFQALNAQIRPHFLFNTLHTIGQLWRSGRDVDADAVLDRLGSLMHKVRATTSGNEVPLADELELVRDYLAIEQTRFHDRLTTVVDAPPETLECLVPPLILQPLVENAVRHGIAAVSTAGLVEVRATRADDRLRLTVRDDGPGMDATSPSPGTGTGLRTTAERLAQLYGDAGRITVQSETGKGTTVHLDLPAHV